MIRAEIYKARTRGLIYSMSKGLKFAAYIFAIIGILDSAYLSYTKLVHSEVFCGTSSQCSTVNNSSYAEIGGIPIALLGMGAFLGILALLVLEGKYKFWKDNAPMILFGITLIGVLYSAFLTYIEFAVLFAVCPYCIVSAICMTLLFLVSIIHLVQVFRD